MNSPRTGLMGRQEWETAGPANAVSSPITWYGGKGRLARHIVPLLPPHDTYVEPFFGGGSVFFAKPPAAIEVINDIHAGVVTLYRVLRDHHSYAEFLRLAHLTPYSRHEWSECSRTWQTETDPVQQAWMFFVTARQTFSGHVGGGAWKVSVADPGTRAVGGWLSAIERLPEVHARLREAQIENDDWRDILLRYDAPNILHYLDPPYVLSSRDGRHRYEFEMSDVDHGELTDALLTMQSMIVLSGFRLDWTHSPLEDAGWERHDFDMALNAARHRTGARRLESVWLNPAAAKLLRTQPSLPLYTGEETA